MTITSTFLLILRRSCVVGAIAGVALVVGPASAHKDPVTPEQLKAYQDAFMEEVRKGDLLFHGDGATAKKMGVNLSDHGHGLCNVPSHGRRYPPALVPEVAGASRQILDAARHDQLVHRKT